MTHTKEGRAAAQAFLEQKDFNGRFARVNVRQGNAGVGVWVDYVLHGWIIAQTRSDCPGVVFMGHAGSISTMINRDRLNTLCDAMGMGQPFYHRKGKQYFNGREISLYEVIPVSRGVLSQMVLDLERAQGLNTTVVGEGRPNDGP